MLRLQCRATQLRHAAGKQLSQMVSDVRSKLPGRMAACKYSTAKDAELKEGPIKKLMVANRGRDRTLLVKYKDYTLIPKFFALFDIDSIHKIQSGALLHCLGLFVRYIM